MISTEEAKITEMVDCDSWEGELINQWDFVVECFERAMAAHCKHYWDQIRQSTEAAVNVKVRYTEVAVRAEH